MNIDSANIGCCFCRNRVLLLQESGFASCRNRVLPMQESGVYIKYNQSFNLSIKKRNKIKAQILTDLSGSFFSSSYQFLSNGKFIHY
jgi:hypothetical protein